MSRAEYMREYRKANPEKVREYDRQYRKRNPEQNRAAQRRYKRKTVYGVTDAQYDAMLAEQGGLCKLCRGTPNGRGILHIDHCHATGRIRGLLCSKCNTALGLLNDDVELFAKALRYLAENKE